MFNFKRLLPKSLSPVAFVQSLYLNVGLFFANDLMSSASACAFGFLFSFIPVSMMIFVILFRFLHATPDVQNFMQLFYGKNVSPGVNHANYSNQLYDAAYEKEDFAECQRIVREDCPWVFTHYNKAYSLVGPRVENYIPSDFPYGMERHYKVKKK